MVKFSIDGDDDGEGPSNPRRKRQRVSVLIGTAGGDVEEQTGTAEEELEGEESEQEQEGMQSEENDDDPTFANNDDGTPLSIRIRSNNSGREDSASVMNDDDTPLRIRLRSSNSGRENDVSVIKGRDKYVSVFLTDPEVLDCFICYEPLSIPVFQCENGHTACHSCCVKIGNKCPMCSMPIGYNRCRAIEKVLESLKIPCLNTVYGCQEILRYSKKSDHEKECIYTPCFCPHSSCNFTASSKELSIHFSHKHEGLGVRFRYDHFFSVFLGVNDKTIVLQDQDDGNLFILNNEVEILGNLVSVSSIAPNSSKPGFHYELLAKFQGCCLKLQSFISYCQGPVATTPSSAFLLIPPDFFGSSGQLKLDICIGRNVNTPCISIGLGCGHL